MNLLSSSLAVAGAVSIIAASNPIPAEIPIEPALTIYDGEDISVLSVEDYIVGVVLSEMPYTFHPEALKAQAVAARTYFYYCEKNNSHPHTVAADVCTDMNHCCGYISESDFADKYGDDYAKKAVEAVRNSVYGTKGKIMRYDGEPILAAWHSSSAGHTENCGEVWLCELPYLISVSTPEAVREETVSFPLSDVRRRLKSEVYSYNGRVGISITKNDSGRCDRLKIGNVTLTGKNVRRIFSLKSTNFDAMVHGGQLYFRVKGYGHGVGLSQYGAETMAGYGLSYEEILCHYYRGAALSS